MSDSTDSSPPPRGFTSEELIRWERVRQRLRVELGDAIYDSWFAGLELERVDGDGVQLTVPTKFLKSWMQTHYLDRIRARVAAEFGTVERVTIELRTPGRKVKARKAEAERTAPAPQDQKLCSASSRRAGGTGLNLTAADYVVHLDPWWNPAVEDQASDRAHRIGQTRPVTIYRLVMADSIEQRIVELHRAKRELAAELLEGADTAGRLTEQQLLELIAG